MKDLNYFKLFFDNSSQAVLVVGAVGINIYHNASYEQAFPKNSSIIALILKQLGAETFQDLIAQHDFDAKGNISLQIFDSNHILITTLRPINIESQKLYIIEITIKNHHQSLPFDRPTLENLLFSIIDLVPEGIFLKDNQRRLMLVNKTYKAFHTHVHKSLIGLRDEDIKLDSREYSKFVNVDEEIIANNKPIFIENEILIRADGNTVTLSAYKIPFQYAPNQKPGILGISVDISDKVLLQEYISSNRKMQKQIADLVPHMIFLKDGEGRFTFVNKEFLKRTKFKENEVLGKTVFDIYQYEKAQQFTNEDIKVLTTRKEIVFEKEIADRYDGNSTIYDVTKKPYYEYETKSIGVITICIDLTEKVRNKELLNQQKIILNEIINLIPQEIYLKDDEGKMLLVNKACAEANHLSIEQMVGKSDFELFDRAYADKFYAVEQEIIISNIKQVIKEEESLDKYNVKRIKRVMKMPFYLSDKGKNGILGINEDITEIKKVERQIRESEIRYKTLMEQASDGIYLSDDAGKIIAANQKAADMFGYTVEEFSRLNIKKLLALDFSKNLAVSMPFANDKHSLMLERKFEKKDGKTFTAEMSIKLLEHGQHQAIIRDVTLRKKQEKILLDNERKFRSLIENCSDMILILSKNYIIKFMSPSVCKLLNFNENELIGSSIQQIIPDSKLEETASFLAKLIAQAKSVFKEEITFKDSNNQQLLFETVGVNMIDDDNINGIIINCHDITQRKHTEVELLNTNFELDSFVYKASHDLKAPLRSVMGLVKLAKLECKDDNLQIYFDMMTKSVTSLDQFIKDLTQFSRNSRMEIEPILIDFKAIVEETLLNLKYVERGEKIAVHINTINRGDFYSDATRINTIINNLLSNAFKYHRFDDNNPYLNIDIHANEKEVVITVADNGIGIESIHIEHIFEMFYRASETSYGSGLGLYILKSAISKLKGTVHVNSKLGEGTTFIVTIPNLLYNDKSK